MAHRSAWPPTAALFTSMLALAWLPAAHGHGIETSLQRLADLRAGADRQTGAAAPTYRLETSFSSGEPVGDAVVSLVPPAGGAGLEVGRTDSLGRLSFQLPAQAQADWELKVDAGPGHRDYLDLQSSTSTPGTAPRPAASLPPALPTALALIGLVALGAGRRRA